MCGLKIDQFWEFRLRRMDCHTTNYHTKQVTPRQAFASIEIYVTRDLV